MVYREEVAGVMTAIWRPAETLEITTGRLVYLLRKLNGEFWGSRGKEVGLFQRLQ